MALSTTMTLTGALVVGAGVGVPEVTGSVATGVVPGGPTTVPGDVGVAFGKVVWVGLGAVVFGAGGVVGVTSAWNGSRPTSPLKALTFATVAVLTGMTVAVGVALTVCRTIGADDGVSLPPPPLRKKYAPPRATTARPMPPPMRRRGSRAGASPTVSGSGAGAP